MSTQMKVDGDTSEKSKILPLQLDTQMMMWLTNGRLEGEDYDDDQ